MHSYDCYKKLGARSWSFSFMFKGLSVGPDVRVKEVGLTALLKATKKKLKLLAKSDNYFPKSHNLMENMFFF